MTDTVIISPKTFKVHNENWGTLICGLPYITEEIEFDNRLMFYETANVINFDGVELGSHKKTLLRDIEKKKLVVGKVVLTQRGNWRDWNPSDRNKVIDGKWMTLDHIEWRLHPDGKRCLYGGTWLCFGYWDHPELQRGVGLNIA